MILILSIIIIIWLIPTIILISLEEHTELVDKGTSNIDKIFSIVDLYNTFSKEIVYSISIDNNIVFENKMNINVQIENFDENCNYSIKVLVNENVQYNEKISNKDNTIQLELIDEGEKNINVIIYLDNVEKINISKLVYYIKPYNKQFLDELSNKGVQVHYKGSSYQEDYEKSLNLIEKLGSKYVRADIFYWDVVKSNGVYDFSHYDKWINVVKDKNINLILELNGFPNIINTDSKIQKFSDFSQKVMERYPFVKYYEVLNEPNNNKYIKEDDVKWYSKVVQEISKRKINDNIAIIGGGLARYVATTDSHMSTVDFLKILTQNKGYKYSNAYSYHVYDDAIIKSQNPTLISYLKETNSLINSFGGFIKKYITEYGLSTYNKITDEIQADRLIQQTVLMDKYGLDITAIYNFHDIGNDVKSREQNFGIVNNDYTPKKSYYALKNYYENTNGSEYIGTLNIEKGLEANVYNKDGKPLIIAWSDNKDKKYTIPKGVSSIKDIYGKEIVSDNNGNVIITTSPVYISNINYNYFYQAISNMATEKYNEFTEKFAGEIEQVPELTSKIEENKKYMESVGQVENKIVGSATIQAMKNHFELGNLILQAYKDGKLQAEDVKISSMLDMLNDIGDSYEDLVTVSAQTVEQSEIEQTNNVMQETETIINNNQGCEIIYPVKILDFAKDHYEKATYINSLEEENDIKNGLIISNNLHASLLANWAKEFAQINIDKFVDEYITNNPVTIEYSTTEFTNQNVKATIKTNAEIQITNNSNSKEHTFEQNGSFTFEYTIKGRALNITATVQNIDKVEPSISGVQKAKLYTKPVTPKINDENLKEIKLILNSQVVTDYKNGDTLQDEGFYELTAIDKAGNTTTTYFQIFINNDTNYKMEENYIKNVTNNTKKSDFDKKLNLSVGYKIYRNGIELKPDDIIATGDILTTEAGDSYTIIVPGDINKDGLVNLKDFIKMRIYLLLENNLDDVEIIAADCNNDNQPVGVKDYIRMRLIILMSEL